VILLALLLWGLVAGWLANLLLGGGMRSDNWAELLVAGLVGSFVGGLLVNLLAGDGLALRPSGIIGSVIGAVIVLAAARWWRSRAA
jgi:uncharacterized membrane protein YeaQ/YmgE (transglycosylase-associated protein family)